MLLGGLEHEKEACCTLEFVRQSYRQVLTSLLGFLQGLQLIEEVTCYILAVQCVARGEERQGNHIEIGPHRFHWSKTKTFL